MFAAAIASSIPSQRPDKSPLGLQASNLAQRPAIPAQDDERPTGQRIGTDHRGGNLNCHRRVSCSDNSSDDPVPVLDREWFAPLVGFILYKYLAPPRIGDYHSHEQGIGENISQVVKAFHTAINE